MRFSILVSAHNRAHTIPRCLDSLLYTQGHDDIEVVLINDGSIDNTEDVVEPYLQRHKNIIYLKNPVRMERVYSYGLALEKSTGDWLIHIGSDDILFPRFIEFFFYWVEKYPNSKLFNFGRGAINKHNLRATVAPGTTFEPYKHFNSGMIAAGQFSWHKSISKDISFPVVRSCYDFADSSNIPTVRNPQWEGDPHKVASEKIAKEVEFKGHKIAGYTLIFKTGEELTWPNDFYSKYTRTLGNPWGEDFYMFWKLTRENVSTLLPIIGIVINVR